MADQEPGIDKDFPDVSLGAGAALAATLLLALVFGLVYALSARLTELAPPQTLIAFGVAAWLLLLSYIDLRTGLLPDALTLPLMLGGLVNAIYYSPGWLLSALGLLVGYLLIAALAFLWRRYRGYEGIGLGDAKLLAAAGAWVGLQLLPLVLMLASALGLMVALTVSQKPRHNSELIALPFGPCLALGFWSVWCLDDILARILSGTGL